MTLIPLNTYWDVIVSESVGAKPTNPISVTYDGNSHTTGYTRPEGVNVTGVESAVNAGTYSATYTPDEEHEWSDGTRDSVTVTFVIAKANPVYSAPVNANPTYNGQSQHFMTAGSVVGGTLYYKILGGEWSATRPSAVNAGQYDTYWYIAGDANHNDVAATYLWCTIAKAVGSCSGAINLNPTYNGQWQLIVGGATGTGVIVYSFDHTNWYQGVGYTDAGGRTVYYKAQESTNYLESAEQSIYCSVSPCPIDTFALNWQFAAYTGNPRTVQIQSVSGGGLSATYTTGGTITATDVGYYTVSVTGTGNFTGTLSQSWSIGYVWHKYNADFHYADTTEDTVLAANTSALLLQSGTYAAYGRKSNLTFDQSTGAYSMSISGISGDYVGVNLRTPTTTYSGGQTAGTIIPNYIAPGTVTSFNEYVEHVSDYASLICKLFYTGYVKNTDAVEVGRIATVRRHHPTGTYSRGDYIIDVVSYSNDYPADGVHTDGYWYTKTW